MPSRPVSVAQMFEVFLKGLAVGFAIAVPVGPIGLLCIRRSMTEGRAAGLATGLGAAAADGTYGFLVAAGVAASGLLLSYTTEMQLFGGLLIAVLGVLSARAFFQPRPEAAALAPSRNIASAFGTTYLLTLSNPMTIIAFTGMIAGLGAAAGAGGQAAYVLVLGVFLGSALWWLILVQLALWARKRLTGNALKWLDLLAGSALILWGLQLALTAGNGTR